MRSSPFSVVDQFEQAVAGYCGSPFCVSTTSCTTGLLLALRWYFEEDQWCPRVSLPRFTYVGVAMSVLNAGGSINFRDEQWEGMYQISPLPLWDSARLTTSGMYKPDSMMVLSMHWAKHLGTQQGGLILLDDPEADAWLRKARFDGRTAGVPPSEDTFNVRGIHAYLSPEVAAAGLMRLSLLPQHNDPLPWDDYVDLSKIALFS